MMDLRDTHPTDKKIINSNPLLKDIVKRLGKNLHKDAKYNLNYIFAVARGFYNNFLKYQTKDIHYKSVFGEEPFVFVMSVYQNNHDTSGFSINTEKDYIIDFKRLVEKRMYSNDKKKKLTQKALDKFIKDRYDDIKGIMDMMLSPLCWYIIPSYYCFEKLVMMQEDFHANIESGDGKVSYGVGEVMLRWEEDGHEYYWVNLKTQSSLEEGSAMNHCGFTPSDTLMSLRKRVSEKESTPLLTIGADLKKDGDTIYIHINQMKGPWNTRPPKKHHEKIIRLLVNDGKYIVTSISHEEYKGMDDFWLEHLNDEQLNRVLLVNPGILKNSWIEYNKIDYTRLTDENLEKVESI